MYRRIVVRSALGMLVACSITSACWSQPVPFGSVSEKDFLSSTRTDSASAVVLFDKGELKVEPNSTSGTVLKRHVRIKIISKQGLEDWASNSLYVGSDGQVKVRGATYNYANGIVTKTEVADENIIKTNYKKGRRIVSVEFPNAREGSILDLTYTESYPELYVAGWKFQMSIPVLWSEYSVSIPVRNMVYHLKGEIQPTEHEEKYEGRYHRWVMKNIPAFTPEPMMPDRDVYISEVQFATRYSSWEEVYNRLIISEDFWGIIKNHNSLKKTAQSIIEGIPEELAKVKAISEFVKNNVVFNGTYDFTARDPAIVLETKTGSSADINLLFASLLSKAGFDVEAVLIRTRDLGLVVEELPTLYQFNNVMCRVRLSNEKLLMLDATEKGLAYDQLPPDNYNFKGFVVSPSKFGWIEIESRNVDRKRIEANISIEPSGSLGGKVKTIREGHAAFYTLKKSEAKSNLGEITDIASDSYKIQRSDFKFLEGKVEEEGNFRIEDQVTSSQEVIYVNPHIFLRETSNPFVTERRRYPVDLVQVKDYTVVTHLLVPDGYHVDELPRNHAQVIPGNLAKSTISYSRLDDRIIVIYKLQINKTIFFPTEYPALKEFYARLVSFQSETIVLKKN